MVVLYRWGHRLIEIRLSTSNRAEHIVEFLVIGGNSPDEVSNGDSIHSQVPHLQYETSLH